MSNPATAAMVAMTLRSVPTGLTVQMCSKRVGLSESTVRVHLNNMVNAGQALRTPFVKANGQQAHLFVPKT